MPEKQGFSAHRLAGRGAAVTETRVAAVRPRCATQRFFRRG